MTISGMAAIRDIVKRLGSAVMQASGVCPGKSAAF
jgi:hypothetical protein